MSARARATIAAAPFHAPAIPLIDAAGRIWRPRATHPPALWDYTLGTQATTPYDFTAAVRVSVREFAPERVIILGPGDTLGGAVAQSLIAARWRGLDTKAAFTAGQAARPYVLAMGREEQRAVAVGG